MDIESAKELLQKAGYKIVDEGRLKNDTGSQVKLSSKQIVNVFDNGSVSVQGKDPKPIEALLKEPIEVLKVTPNSSNKIFVVYGHDTTARDQLEIMIRRWGLDPVILDRLVSEGQTVIEKLENYSEDVRFAIILATPDDEGNRRGHPDEKAFRARQNVILELGMMLSQLGRRNVAILLKEQEKMERPSDIQGLIYIPFKDDLIKETQVPLAKEMVSCGFKIQIDKL